MTAQRGGDALSGGRPTGLTEARVAREQPPAGEPAEAYQADRAGARRRGRRNGMVIAAVAAALLGVLLLQSLMHGHLTGNDEYDDGVYFGASLQLLHGILPYRDFAFIQPPMVSVLLLPFAALSGVAGTAHGFEAARIFIDLVTTANVVLAGLLVRHRPTLQVLVSTGIMAAYPATVRASQTVLLEPLLVFFCLAGLLSLFDGDKITTSQRRIVACGVLFGVAGATKLWAVLPFLAVLCVAGTPGLGTRCRLLAGGAAGFLACSLPFIIGSPGAFIRDVFVTQAERGSSGYLPLQRMADLTGLPGLYSLITADAHRGAQVLAVVIVVMIVLCLLAFSGNGRAAPSRLDWFALLATVATVIGLYSAPSYYYHYAAFAAPFAALLYGTVALRLRERFAAVRTVAVAAAAIPVLLMAIMLGLRIDTIVSAGPAGQAGTELGTEIPRHGCVLSFDPGLAILDNRFTGDVAGCPEEVDWDGEERVLDGGVSQTESDTRSRTVQAVMMRWIRASVAIITPWPNPGWDRAVVLYVRHNFRRERRNADSPYVYVRRHALQD